MVTCQIRYQRASELLVCVRYVECVGLFRSRQLAVGSVRQRSLGTDESGTSTRACRQSCTLADDLTGRSCPSSEWTPSHQSEVSCQVGMSARVRIDPRPSGTRTMSKLDVVVVKAAFAVEVAIGGENHIHTSRLVVGHIAVSNAITVHAGITVAALRMVVGTHCHRSRTRLRSGHGLWKVTFAKDLLPRLRQTLQFRQRCVGRTV
jgi:hypothetical protein